MTSLLTAAACVGLIALNFLATARVIADTTLSDNQRIAWLAGIWLVPLVGAAAALLMRPRAA
jgi:hypothetical protein